MERPDPLRRAIAAEPTADSSDNGRLLTDVRSLRVTRWRERVWMDTAADARPGDGEQCGCR